MATITTLRKEALRTCGFNRNFVLVERVDDKVTDYYTALRLPTPSDIYCHYFSKRDEAERDFEQRVKEGF